MQVAHVVRAGAERRRRGWIGRLVLAAGLLLTSALPVQTAAAASDAPTDPAPRTVACQYAPTHRVAQVSMSGLREASGLVASQQWPGVYWTINDSGNAPMLYAFDQDGASRGTFKVTGASNVDWEALALGPDDNGGFALYIGDTGDNDQIRRDPVIYRVPEPEPAPAGSATVGETAPAATFRFVFPGRSHNAEAMMVHPKTGEVTLITREVSGLSLVYRLPAPLDGDNVTMADMVDVLDIRPLGPGPNSQVTDATMSSDGHHIAVRTYSAVLLFDAPDGIAPDQLWGQAPSIVRLADGPKGEGITYKLDSDDLMTVGEETPAGLYETSVHC
jgi:hypothetical protein